VRIADLKKEARALEQAGDAAAALTLYDEILGELERLALQPDGALCIKVGDLSLKTGQRSRAVSMFEHAADEYAREGSHKAVIALSLKILRTNPRRKDVHIRYSKVLFRQGHVEAARLVLVDYAERTGLDKTLHTLQSIAERSESEQRAKLEKFFEMADRASNRSGERPSISTPRPSAAISMSETTEHLAAMVPVAEEDSGEPEEAEPVLLPSIAANDADPIVASIMASRSAADEPEPPRALPEPARTESPSLQLAGSGPSAPNPPAQQHPGDQAHHVAALAVVDGGNAPLGRIRRALKSRHLWPWPAAAAAVLVLGVGLMGFGAIPFGGDLDADEPETSSPVAAAVAARPGPMHIDTTAPDLSAQGQHGVQETGDEPSPGLSEPASRLAGADDVPEGAAAVPTTPGPQRPQAAEPASRGSSSTAPAQLTGLSNSALMAASQTAVEVRVQAADLDAEITEAGKIAIPAAETGARPTSSRAAATPAAERSIIAIEGLEVVGLVGSGDSYRLIQHLDSGESVAITVVPFAEAPSGESGTLAVQAGAGDSIIGTRRFYDSFVTIESEISRKIMEGLLDGLQQRSWR
jgi:hypothetical protein